MIVDLNQFQWTKQMEGLHGLFIVATPIGHMEDISLRALVTLGCVDSILCEDTRVTRQLLSHYNISTTCYSYHSHSERKKLNGIMCLLKKGHKLALVSDRGTPLISDPGYILVKQCYQEGIPVHGIPGASSLLLAAVLSGISCQSFFFQGFLPHKRQAKHLQELSALSVPVIFFESPHRLLSLITQLETVFGNRNACLLRELTKKFEERIEGTLKTLELWVQQAQVLGECVLVVEGLK